MIHIWSCTCSWIFFVCVFSLWSLFIFRLVCCDFTIFFQNQLAAFWCPVIAPPPPPPFKKLVTLLQAKVWPAILTSFLAGYILYDIIYHDLYMKYNVLNSFLFCVSLWSLFVFRLVCCDFTNFFPQKQKYDQPF